LTLYIKANLDQSLGWLLYTGFTVYNNFVLTGTFGAAVSVVSEGQEEIDLRSVEQQCNTHIQLLPGNKQQDVRY